MDSFRNFMENNQYLKGGATPSAAPSSSGAITLPTENDISNLKKNAAALVDKDRALDAKDADLESRVKTLETTISRLESKESQDIKTLTEKLTALEGAVMEITNLLAKLAN